MFDRKTVLKATIEEHKLARDDMKPRKRSGRTDKVNIVERSARDSKRDEVLLHNWGRKEKPRAKVEKDERGRET